MLFRSGINEIKISEQGEILTRGANVFVGYLNLPDKTAEAIDAEGWLHTGDVGEIDAEGFVRITDRMKDIIITAGGKNITPSEIENELKFSPYITDAVVVGDRKPYLSLLVMIDHENVEQYAHGRGRKNHRRTPEADERHREPRGGQEPERDRRVHQGVGRAVAHQSPAELATNETRRAGMIGQQVQL